MASLRRASTLMLWVGTAATGSALAGLENHSWWGLAAAGVAGAFAEVLAARAGGGRSTPSGSMSGAPIPHQLPAGLPDFVGRADEIALLRGPARRRGGPTADIRVICGPGGIGKTSLVIHAVEQVIARFPDGQLYVDLQGYGPNPLTARHVLGGWLRDLGMDERRIPAGLMERSREFRSIMSGRRAAIVLDNASGEEQIRPLLVASGRCVTFISSRDPLGGLAASLRLRLDGLSVTESLDLLSRVLGRERIEEEAAAARQLSDIAGGLPLALRVLSGRLVDGSQPITSFLGRLARQRAENRLLSEFTFGDLSVEQSVAISREHLTEPTRRAFDLLGLHPADEWSNWSVAALCGCSLTEAQDLTGLLSRAQLVRTKRTSGFQTPRFYLHDLVREFARDQAARQLTGQDRDAAVVRLASAYLAMADLADRAIHPSGVRHQGRTDAPRHPLDAESEQLAITDPFGWFRLESEALAAVVSRCRDIGAWELCWELSDACSVALENLRLWDVGARCAETGLEAAEQLDADRARAAVLRNLGEIDRELGAKDTAVERLEQSVDLFKSLDDPFGVIDASSNLGLVQMRWGDPQAAQERLREALDTARGTADARGVSWTLEILGECAALRGDTDTGVRCLREATALFEVAGEQRGQAFALSNEALLALDDAGWTPGPCVAPGNGRTRDASEAAWIMALLDRADGIFHELGDARNSALVAVARIRERIVAGRDREARALSRTAKPMEGFELDWRLRGLLVHCDAVLDHRRGARMSAVRGCERALVLVQPFGDRLSTAGIRLHLGVLAQDGRRPAEATGHYRAARELYRSLRREDGLQVCEQRLAQVEP